MKKPINIRIDSELWGQIQRVAAEHKVTATSLVEASLMEFLGLADSLKSADEDLRAGRTKGLAAPVKITPEMEAEVDAYEERLDTTGCPYTAKQLRGKSNGALTDAAAERAIKDGTWRRWL